MLVKREFEIFPYRIGTQHSLVFTFVLVTNKSDQIFLLYHFVSIQFCQMVYFVQVFLIRLHLLNLTAQDNFIQAKIHETQYKNLIAIQLMSIINLIFQMNFCQKEL